MAQQRLPRVAASHASAGTGPAGTCALCLASSRITSVRSPDAGNLARIFIDSDNWTNVMSWDGDPAHPTEGRNWFRAFPFPLWPFPLWPFP